MRSSPTIDSPMIGVVVLNYNSVDDTLECLSSLKKLVYDNVSIVIVDNNSPDGSYDALCETSGLTSLGRGDAACGYVEIASGSNLTILKTSKNIGYGGGNNVGIRHAISIGCEYVLILNNDTVTDSDILGLMLNAGRTEDNVGIVSCKIYFYSDRERLWYNGGAIDTCTSKVTHYDFNQVDKKIAKKRVSNFASGCAMLISADTLADVGLFKEDYFMYVEDVEFSMRMNHKGYGITICDKAVVYHKVGASSAGRLSEFSVYYMARNRVRFVREYYRGFCKVVALVYSLFIYPLKFVRIGRFGLFYLSLKVTIQEFVK